MLTSILTLQTLKGAKNGGGRQNRRNSSIQLLLYATILVHFCLFPVCQTGPAISGLPDGPATEEGKSGGGEGGGAESVADKLLATAAHQERRHAFNVLEPELAESIFQREGAKNPLQRTTTKPLTEQQRPLEEDNRKGGGEKKNFVAHVAPRAQAPVLPANEEEAISSSSGNHRNRRAAAAARSEYDALNDDFITEYDSLNLDFNLDEQSAGKEEAKEVEVPAREFIWQEGRNRTGDHNEDKKDKGVDNDDDGEEEEKEEEEIFPPKEWWGDDNEEEGGGEGNTTMGTAQQHSEASTPTTTTTQLPTTTTTSSTSPAAAVTIIKADGIKAIVEKNKKMMKASKLLVNWHVGTVPFDGKQIVSRRRARRDVIVENGTTETAADGGTSSSFSSASVSRQQLKVLPKLVPIQQAAAAASTPPTTTPTPKTTRSTLASRSFTQSSGIHSKHSMLLIMPKGQHVPETEFLHDLPSGLDAPGNLALTGDKTAASTGTRVIQQQQQQQKPNPLPNAGFLMKDGNQAFPASSSASLLSVQPSPNPDHQHRHRVPPGFQHVATLVEPPKQINSHEILIDGQRYWVERTVPISEFFPKAEPPANPTTFVLPSPQQQPQTKRNNNNKEPTNMQLPPLLDLPMLDDNDGEGFLDQKTINNGKMPPRVQSPYENAVLESNWLGPEKHQQHQHHQPPVRAQANSARVFSLPEQHIPVGAQQQPEQQQQAKRNNKNNNKVRFPDNRSGLFALNLGTVLSQIFGNFTIEHDARPLGGNAKQQQQQLGQNNEEGGGEQRKKSGSENAETKTIGSSGTEGAFGVGQKSNDDLLLLAQQPEQQQQQQPRLTRYYDRVLIEPRNRHLHGN